MASVSQLRIVHGAGEPDDVLAKRIDVVQASVRFYDAVMAGDDLGAIDTAENTFFTAVRRYKSAIKRRQRERTS